MDRKRFLIILAVSILFLWLSLDGYHYWHDVRFLYAASQFSMSEILAGYFNPHQFGGPIDELGASGYYLAKVLHIWLLKGLFNLINPALGGFYVAVWLSILFVSLSIMITCYINKRMGGKKLNPLFVFVCMTIAPITPYLAGKILSEVTSFVLMTISILCFVIGLDQKTRLRMLVCILISGVFLLFTGLARIDMTLSFWGFWIAAIYCYPKNIERSKIIKCGVFVVVFFIIAYFSVISHIGMDSHVLQRYFVNYVGLETKSIAMSFLGVLTFGGLVYIPIIYTLFSKRDRLTLFFVIWLSLTIGPMILITQNYMVEPRYLTHGLIPLVGLGAIGIEAIREKTGIRLKAPLVVLLIFVVSIVNFGIIRLMPYELDRTSILNAVTQISRQEPKAAIMVPWAYTDFNFLHVITPDELIYNVNSFTKEEHLNIKLRKEWKKRMVKWYGSAYIDNESSLERIIAERPVYYLGWRKYPPMENVKNVTELLGMESLSGLISAFPFRDHLSESWMWGSDAYRFRLAGKCGQYEYYKVDLRNGR